MQKAYHDVQARNAVLEKECVLLRQERSKAQQSAVTKAGDSIEYLDEVTKLEILNEAEPLKLQVKLLPCSCQIIRMKVLVYIVVGVITRFFFTGLLCTI